MTGTFGFVPLDSRAGPTLRPLEPLSAALDVLARRWHVILVELHDYANRSFENGAAHVECLLAARSIEQAFLLNQAYVRRTFDDYVLQLSRVNGLCADWTREFLKPVEAAARQHIS